MDTGLCFGIGIFSFMLGYTVGRLDAMRAFMQSFDGLTPASRSTVQNRVTRKVDIDESTFVTKVEDNFESSGEAIGTTTTTKDDIGAATSKLAQLKKLKG